MIHLNLNPSSGVLHLPFAFAAKKRNRPCDVKTALTYGDDRLCM